MSEEWLRLLSQKPLCDYTPEDYKLYIRSLYYKRPARKTKTIRIKPPKPPYVWKLTPKGNITLKVNRSPKTLTSAEVDLIATESGKTREEITKKANRLKIEIDLSGAGVTP